MRMKKQEKDERIKAKHFSWRKYLTTYIVLLVLSAGQGMIYAEYMNLGPMPTEYIFGMLGYWAIVTAVFCFITARQIIKFYGKPMKKLSAAAKQVAEGDFSVYLEPINPPSKRDYIDVMFEDFNKMVEELGSIETLKDDFIGNVSHEIKTPLSIIQNYATALQAEDLPSEIRKSYANTIITASKNLTTLVSNILKLNRLENQEILPDTKPFDLCRQLSDCAITFESKWEAKNIEFIAEIEDQAVINGDASMLEIVWHNLFSNAIKFTEPGGKISLIQTSEADSVTVQISDSGCGMNAETVKHIFDKFYQGDSSHSGEGNGLGLAITKRVIQLMGGSIWVESEPGKGTTFWVKLMVE